MGMHANGILVYGYDLGGSDEWLVREVGDYGELELGWYDPEDEDGDGFADAAQRRLLIASGFTETWEDRREGYYAREKAAMEALGVEFESYCSSDYPQYVLAAKRLTAHQGHVEDAGAVIAAADDKTRQEWDAKLKRALEALGLTPVQEQPKWLLCSHWG